MDGCESDGGVRLVRCMPLAHRTYINGLTLDVLAGDVDILDIFSDWPATVTYYANCMGLK